MEKISDKDFMRLVTYMKQTYGINLEKKMTLVEGRLQGVINQKGMKSLGEYFDYVLSDKTGAEAKTLVTRLTTNYTYFMREDQHYKYLTSQVLPRLEKTLPNKNLRIWSAGCSSGEEPYTIAMTLDDYFGMRKTGWDTRVLATDISPSVLSMAQEAKYPAERLQNMPPAWKTKYFKKIDADNYQIVPAIKNEVIFKSFNLMDKNIPFKGKFHVIFCRNVMIYFERETREALIERFYDHLAPGGVFFIGLSETMSKQDTRFKFVQPSIYRKD
ncbi:protein-glutamate O-methyltransferase CheR [Oscillospiraceae bacterium OttesenSCG-928-F05]|nr:protein-glutamate O-methyltransferase CheR [Oscillospiraceae bacterium OttesenSCG-928-F05]